MTTRPRSPERTITLAAAGDVCLGDHYFSLGHGVGSRVGAGLDPFDGVSLFRSADLAIANLEAPLSATSRHRDPIEGGVFRAPPGAAAMLDDAGFGIVSIANNHMLQHGEHAFHETLALLDARGIGVAGIADGADGARSRPVIRTVNGLTVGVIACSFVPERYMPGQRLYAAPSVEDFTLEVSALARRVDVVIASVHWGAECTAQPTADVIDAAHAIVHAGAKLVLGHHPHWFQPVERVGDALIAYSLGDLVFDLFWDARSVESAVLRVELGARGVLSHELVPVRFGHDYRVHVQSESAGRGFLATLDRAAARMTAPTDATPPSDEHGARLRKLAYFVTQLPRGRTSDKVRFAAGKAMRALRGTGAAAAVAP